MSRKRFIKLLMANGIQRNKVATIAILYCSRGFSYKKAYQDFLIKQRILLITNRLANAFNMLGNNLKSVTTTLEQYIEAVSHNIRRELMNEL